MLPWSKKIAKSVTFNPEVADETLLAVVEAELAKNPHKTFGDLCKEALWQFLCVPESVRPTGKRPPEPGESFTTELKRQLTDFEQRFFIRESRRLEAMEYQLNQLTQQMAQLSLIVNQQRISEPPASISQPTETKASIPSAIPQQQPTPSPPQEIDDPLLNRLSQVLDDF
jgi:hypothetical protein